MPFFSLCYYVCKHCIWASITVSFNVLFYGFMYRDQVFISFLVMHQSDCKVVHFV